ncbi:unnamed protein product [Blumeria hordei]|uniref:Uncharacterized protein n=1 Tax=Blumeria hordei TaxID=2867405 RepID=A0A383UM36_BLUHO|nr:unnamed protein product [Blumeria hordei]
MRGCFVLIRQIIDPNLLSKVIYHLVLLSGQPPVAVQSNYISEAVNLGHDHKKIEDLMRLNYNVMEERRSPAINLCAKEDHSPNPLDGLGLKFKNSDKKINSFNKRGGVAAASGVIRRNFCTTDDILNYIRLSLVTAVRRDQLHEPSSTMNPTILMDIPVALIDLASSEVGYEFQGFILIFNKDRQIQAFKLNQLNLDSDERTCQPLATEEDAAKIISLAFRSWKDLYIQGLKNKCMVTFDAPFTTTTTVATRKSESSPQKVGTTFITTGQLKEEIL